MSPCLRVQPGSSPRLVTLTGPGGSGKTRLALEVAARLVAAFDGRTPTPSLAGYPGCWFAPLADLTEAERLPEAVRDAMRLPRTPHLEPLEQVVRALARGAPGQPSLLVLDNFEHLVEDGAGVVQTLRERVPSLTLLVTSRQVLGLEGEQEFPLAPLPVPSPRDEGRGMRSETELAGSSSLIPHPSSLLEFPSVRLFVDRAQAARPDFQLTRANAAAVAALCAKLEGLPLAIELAAARAGTLTPAQMLAQLEDRFTFLVSKKRNVIARHRSLEAALDWSYQLLSPDLQRFLARLSVFRGGFTLQAAATLIDFGSGGPVSASTKERHEEQQARAGIARAGLPHESQADAVPPGGPKADAPSVSPSSCPFVSFVDESKAQNAEVLESLERLRECSLVMAEEMGVTSGEWSAAKGGPRRTADCAPPTTETEMRYRLLETLREYAQEELERGGGADAVRRAHAGFFLALAEEAEPHLWGSRQPFWLDRLAREHDNLRAALDGAVERREGTLAVRLAGALAYFWEVRGYWTEGRDRLGRILAMPEAAARTAARAKALLRAGWLAHALADFAAARRLWEESLAIAREIGDRHAMATALTSLGKLSAWPEENPAAARAALEESLAIRRELDDRAGIASTLDGLGNLLRTQGDLEAARRLLEESVALRRELGDRAGVAWSLRGLGIIAYCRGELAAARAYLSECLALFRELGYAQGIALALESLWAALNRLGDAAAARAVLGERLAISQELGSQAMMPQCLEDGALAAQAEREPRRAAVLLAAAGAQREALGISLTPSHRGSLEESAADIRTVLGEAAFAAAWAEGRALSREQAVAVALAEPRDASPTRGRTSGPRRRGPRS